MPCPECGGETLTVPVPEELREYLPADTAAVTICRACLAMSPSETVPASVPDLTVLDDAIPNTDAAAVPLVLLVGLLDSLALHRAEITALLQRIERAGADPLLVLDRLADTYGEDAHVDLAARRRQLEQLL